MAILSTVEKCLAGTAATLKGKGYTPADIRSIGVTNQRETTIVWDPITGKPLYGCLQGCCTIWLPLTCNSFFLRYNAIVWLDARTTETVEALVAATPTKDKTALLSRCGLPISTYFSAVKVRDFLFCFNCPRCAGFVTLARSCAGCWTTLSRSARKRARAAAALAPLIRGSSGTSLVRSPVFNRSSLLTIIVSGWAQAASLAASM